MGGEMAPLLGSNAPAPTRGQSVLKYSSLAVFLVGTVGDQVLTKRATYLARFPAALTLLTAVAGVVVYPTIVLAALASGHVTRPQLRVPWWKPAVVAVGFTLHHVLLNVGASSASVPGIMVMVLAKLVIPASMFMNMPSFTLGLRYGATHWIGLLLLMFGIIVSVLSPLKNEFATSGVAGDQLGSMLLIAVSTIPLAGSFTFIEKNLKEHHQELFTVALWMWICVFQFCLSIVMLPLNALVSGLHMSQMGSDLSAGVACYVTGRTPHDNPRAKDCGQAAAFWWASLVFALAFNLAMPVSTRYGGAALMWFVRGAAVPVAGVLFCSPAVMGVHATQLTWTQVCGLAVVTLGILAFNRREPTKP